MWRLGVAFWASYKVWVWALASFCNQALILASFWAFAFWEVVCNYFAASCAFGLGKRTFRRPTVQCVLEGVASFLNASRDDGDEAFCELAAELEVMRPFS